MNKLFRKIRKYSSFKLGYNPYVITKKDSVREFIPDQYDAIVIISVDFELAWAWRYAKNLNTSTSESHILLAQRERNNISIILGLSEKYKIPLTWAIVGHLFLDKCSRTENHIHQEIVRIPYFENNWWKYKCGDWFDEDPASDCIKSPEWYCPDLIRLILKSTTKHELACHTFSHIPCDDETCEPNVLESEINACKKASNKFGISLESFVFPGHTMGNFKTIKKYGFSSVRTNYRNTLGYPSCDENGLWRHPATMEIKYDSDWSNIFNLNKYLKIIDLAIKKNVVCHFWFHPSLEETHIQKLLKPIFEYLSEKRNSIWVTTMKDYTNWLKNNSTT